MNREFVPYDIAKAMKELGFDEPCISIYDEDYICNNVGFYIDDEDSHVSNKQLEEANCITAPLYQQAFRWFREKYGYNTQISEVLKWCYVFIIEKWEDKRFVSDNYSKVSEAQDACLRKLIEIVKKKQDEKTTM